MSIIKGGVRVQCLEKEIKLIVQTRLVNAWETELPYEQALAKSDLCLLSTRRQVITDRLFQSIIKDNDHKLKSSYPTSVNIIITYVDSGNSNLCLKVTDSETVSLDIIQSKKHRKELFYGYDL